MATSAARPATSRRRPTAPTRVLRASSPAGGWRRTSPSASAGLASAAAARGGSRLRLANHGLEDLDVLLEVADAEELLAHALLRRAADARGRVRVGQQAGHGGADRGQVARVDQHATLAV